MTTETDSALTGSAYDLAAGGYVPMPIQKTEDESEAISGDSVSLREAAAQRGETADELIVRGYTGPTGEPVAANEAITLARASHDYAAVTAAERLVAANKNATVLAAEVDALRAEALANDPDAAELYGIDPPPAEEAAEYSGEVDDIEPGPPDGEDAADPSLDRELEKALQHPQVRYAIEQQLGEAERMRQTYLDGIAAATQIAQASFLSQFPELAAVAPENLPAALEQLSQQDPARFEQVRTMVAASEKLLERQRQESALQIELNRQNFENYARSEDARFETMMKGEARETQAAVSAEIVASAKASGIEPAELNHLFQTEPLMRNAVFQRMMYDAGKYRLMMRARTEAVSKPLPPVVRPGMARVPSERQQVDLRALNTRLSSTGSIKDAVALYHARKSSR